MRDTWYIDFLPMRAPIEASFEKAGGGDFVLPIASSEILGGVKPVAKTEDMIQPVGVDAEGRLWVKESRADVNNIATDDEIIGMLIQEDMLPVVVNFDGSILADEDNNILLW